MDNIELRTEKINDDILLSQICGGILFGTDALSLADYITREHMGAFRCAVELGAGSGVISLLLASREKARSIYAVEIQELYAELAQKNIDGNGFGGIVRLIRGDIKMPDSYFYSDGKTEQRFLPHTADMVFTNPPYMKCGTGEECERDYKNIARREVLCTLDDVCSCAFRLLKNKGVFYCVYRPERFAELIFSMKSHGIEPKKCEFIFPANKNEACLTVVKGIKGAAEGFMVSRTEV